MKRWLDAWWVKSISVALAAIFTFSQAIPAAYAEHMMRQHVTQGAINLGGQLRRDLAHYPGAALALGTTNLITLGHDLLEPARRSGHAFRDASDAAVQAHVDGHHALFGAAPQESPRAFQQWLLQLFTVIDHLLPEVMTVTMPSGEPIEVRP